MWPWYEKSYFAHDIANRVTGFVSYIDDEQFSGEALRLAGLAAEKINEYRKMFREISDAKRYLVEHVNAGSPWPSLYAGIACGLSGDSRRARAFLENVGQFDAQYDWVKNLKAKAAYLAELLDHETKFKVEIERTILSARQMLKLPQRESIDLA